MGKHDLLRYVSDLVALSVSFSLLRSPTFLCWYRKHGTLHGYVINGTLWRTHSVLEARLKATAMEHVSTGTQLSIHVDAATKGALRRSGYIYRRTLDGPGGCTGSQNWILGAIPTCEANAILRRWLSCGLFSVHGAPISYSSLV
mmetsp:Transcript_16146/g.46356  ORF Transcript_16146/g.46356 Transcript_16146/m.46356 type:complete len:144 (-) Transcript_16146:2001-2432(-)